MAKRILIWVQSLLGSGHLRRALTLAQAMADEGLDVTLANGGKPPRWTMPAGVRLVQLPPLRSADEVFGTLVDETGRPIDDAWRAGRRAALLRAVDEARPDVLITEMFPFGRRALRFELLPLLERIGAMRPRPRVVASVRDILVRKAQAARYDEMRDLCLAHFDRVLVHSDEAVTPFDLTFPHAAALGDRIVYTGYVLIDRKAQHGRSTERPEVLVSAGGGAVGAALLRAAIGARPLTASRDAPWRLVTGANISIDDFARLEREVPDGITLDRELADFPAHLANCLFSISQAGYNTMLEAYRARRRMVLVPFRAGGETEQATRAERWADLRMAAIVRGTEVTPETLATAIDEAAGIDPDSWPQLDIEGAATSARIVAQLAGDRAS